MVDQIGDKPCLYFTRLFERVSKDPAQAYVVLKNLTLHQPSESDQVHRASRSATLSSTRFACYHVANVLSVEHSVAKFD